MKTYLFFSEPEKEILNILKSEHIQFWPHIKTGKESIFFVINDDIPVFAAQEAFSRFPDAEFGFFYHKQFVNVIGDDFNTLQASAYTAQDWRTIRQFNRMKIMVNRILRRPVFDSFPRILQIESSSLCNGKCIMCCHSYLDAKDGSYLPFAVHSHIEHLLPYAEMILLHGLGEPFLNPDIIRWLELYHAYQIHISTFTNMTVLTDLILHAIGKFFSSLHISCDGCTKETFETIRKGLSFDTFMCNVRKVHQTYPNITLHLHAVGMRQNLHEIPDFAYLAKKLGFSSVTFSNLTVNPLLKNQKDSLRECPDLAAKQYELLRESGKNLGLAVFTPSVINNTASSLETAKNASFNCDTHISRTINQKELTKPENLNITEPLMEDAWQTSGYRCYGLCDWLSERAYIDLHGSFILCCSKYYLSMGNALDDCRSAWNTIPFQRMRESFFRGDLPAVCQGCKYLMDRQMPSVKITNEDDLFRLQRPVGNLYKAYLAAKKPSV